MENDTNMSIEQGRTEEAEKLYLQVLVSETRVLGAKHPDTLTTIHNRSAGIL